MINNKIFNALTDILLWEGVFFMGYFFFYEAFCLFAINLILKI